MVCVVPNPDACAKRRCLLLAEGRRAHSDRAQCTLLRHLLSTAQQGTGHAYAHMLLLFHSTVLAGETLAELLPLEELLRRVRSFCAGSHLHP